MKAVFDRLTAAARTLEHSPAISDEHRQLTFGQLATEAGALAAWLRTAPMRPVVLIGLPNGPDFAIALFACFAADAIAVPVPPDCTAAEAARYAEGLAADVLITADATSAHPWSDALAGHAVRVVRATPTEGDRSGLREWDSLSDGPSCPAVPHGLRGREVRLVQFTSGSTARPKAILLTDRNVQALLEADADRLEQRRGKHTLCPLPLFHAMGLAILVERLTHGGAVHCTNRFFPAYDAQCIDRFEIDEVCTSPTHVRLLLQLGVLRAESMPSLRRFELGSAAIDEPLIDRLRTALPAAEVDVRYGLSEAFGTLLRHTVPALDEAPRASVGPVLPLGLVGQPLRGIELDGLPTDLAAPPAELRVRSATAARHQRNERSLDHSNAPAVIPLLDEDGFLPTGDLACRDADGHVHLRGRASTFINRDGHRISPAEIESALASHSAIAEVVVIGTPDPLHEARIEAFYETPDGRPLDRAELLALCQTQLVTFKIPQAFHHRAALPRTAAGKPDRQALAAKPNDATSTEDCTR